jgi:hypothetical protein
VGLQAGDPHLTTGSVALVWVATKTPRDKGRRHWRAPCRTRRHVDSRFGVSSVETRQSQKRLVGSRLPEPRHGEQSGSIERERLWDDRVDPKDRSSGCPSDFHTNFPGASGSGRGAATLLVTGSHWRRRVANKLATPVGGGPPTIKVRKASGGPLHELHGNAHQLGKALCVHALHHPGAMVFHGLRTDVELRGDFLV